MNTYFIGKAQDIVDIFQKEQLSKYICFAAHGEELNNEWGFKLTELGKEIEQQQPYNKILLAENISEFIKLKEQNILSLACCTGNSSLGKVFLEKGANSYIAPEDTPFGSTSLYFSLNFYYWHFVKEKNINDSFDKAMQMMDEEVDKFKLYIV